MANPQNKEEHEKDAFDGLPSEVENQNLILTEADETQDDIFGISDERIEGIREALVEQDNDAVHSLLDPLKAADSADLLEKIDAEERAALLTDHADQFDAAVFSELDSDLRKNLLESLPPKQVADYVSQLDSDDALDLIINLDAIFQKQVIRFLSGRDRSVLEEGLSFPEESAGRLMQREFVAVPEFWTVGKTIDYLRSAAEDLPEDFSDIFVISPTYHVSGELSLSKLLRSGRATRIQDICEKEIHAIPADTDQEEVTFLFKREGLTSAPVVDGDERLIGVITFDDILAVIDEEAEEDLLRLGGVERDDIYRAALDTAKARFAWLAVNLVTAILASVVISFFEATIQQIVALAVLFPIVASMGGNAGTQTLTVAVRALATKELSRSNAMRMVSKELLVGFVNGVLFAVIVGGIAWVWFGSAVLGGVIASAMVVNMITAGFFGIVIPVVLDRMNVDPALASTVFLTTMTDIIGFLAFLGLAALILI